MPILRVMNASLILLWLVSLAQITSGASIPKDAQIFTITLKEGQSERVVKAAVKADGKFVSEFDMAKRPNQVELYFDTPWAPVPPETVLSLKIRAIQPEPPSLKSQRYKESGFEQVDNPKGLWVSSETVARDKRAKELQAALKSDLEAKAAAQVSPVSTGGETPAGPGFARLWGRHIMVLVTAIVVVVAAIKTCF